MVEVIFLEDHGGYKAGTLRSVAPGFARNLLFPKKIAVPATTENRAQLKAKLEEAERRHEEHRKFLSEQKQKLKAAEVTVQRKAGKDGKLHGAVTSESIAEALREKGFDIEKHAVETDDIKKLGAHTVTVRLGEGVAAEVRVTVAPLA